MPKLILLVGPSCTGKSTFARDMASKNRQTYIINRDSIRLHLFGQYRMGNGTEEKAITRIQNNMTENLLVGDNVVISDNTNLNPKYFLQDIEKYAHLASVEVIPMEEVSKVEIVKRNQKRFEETGVLIPGHVIDKQLESFQELKEGGHLNTSFYERTRVMKKHLLSKLLSRYESDSSSLKEIVKDYVKDKSVPLEDRWGMFIESNMGDHKTSVPDGFDALIKRSEWFSTVMIHEFNFNKKEMIAYDTIIAVNNSQISKGEDPLLVSEIDFKSFMMDKFIYSFTLNT